jgi:hypothetical protein
MHAGDHDKTNVRLESPDKTMGVWNPQRSREVDSGGLAGRVLLDQRNRSANPSYARVVA